MLSYCPYIKNELERNMPFTLSHIVAAIPVKQVLKKRTDFLALVIGSMIPDLAYFLPFNVGRDFSHSLLGVFLFCLPLGILLYAAFHLVLKLPLLDLSFGFIKRRIGPELNAPYCFTIRKALIVLSALILGIAGHLLWDSFTHSDSFMVSHFSVFHTTIELYEGIYLPLYLLLQHLSSIAGLILLGFFWGKWLVKTKHFSYDFSSLFSKTIMWVFRFVIMLVPVIGSFVLAFLASWHRGLFGFLKQLVLWLVFTGGKIFLFLLCVYVVIWWIYKLVASIKKTD
ncbi:MAG: DUF4184 family protein [Spirochaetales bacterium]|nr:DUF4184 family protein [Spirochaetales bacterium]